MSIVNSFIFDNKDELVYDASQIEVVTNIDDDSSYNPFSFSGIVGTFSFVASGSPYASSSGEIINFDFNTPLKFKSLTIQQDPTDYAVSYQIFGGVNSPQETLLTYVTASANSGDIYHLFADSHEFRYVSLVIFEVSSPNTYYTIYNISGEASQPAVETYIAPTDISALTATSNVEPVANIYDDDIETFWQSNNSIPQEILFQFRNTKNLSKFEYQSEDNSTYPTSYTLYSSLDGIEYTSFASDSSISTMSGMLTFNPVQTTNYLKVKFTGSAGNKIRIDEIRLYEKSYPQIDVNQIKLKKTVIDTMGMVPSLYASSTAGSNSVTNLIKGVAGDWVSSSSMTLIPFGTVSQYSGNEAIYLNFTTAVAIDNIMMFGYDGDGTPIDFTIEGSNDNNTFDVLRTVTGNSLSEIEIIFDDSEHTSYLFYRIVFTKSMSQYIKLSELNFNIRNYSSQATVELPTVMTDKITSLSVTTEQVDYLNRDIRYLLNIDDRVFWFNGQSFSQSLGTFNQANYLDDIKNNLPLLTLSQNSKVAISAIFSSNGLGTPIINDASITSKNLANAPFIPKGQIRIRGYIAGHVGTPLEMTLSLKRPIKVDGQIIAYTANIIKSDNQGYFDFTLPITELAVPAKEKFSVVIQPLNYRVERYTPNQDNIDLANWIGGNF